MSIFRRRPKSKPPTRERGFFDITYDPSLGLIYDFPIDMEVRRIIISPERPGAIRIEQVRLVPTP